MNKWKGYVRGRYERKMVLHAFPQTQFRPDSISLTKPLQFIRMCLPWIYGVMIHCMVQGEGQGCPCHCVVSSGEASWRLALCPCFRINRANRTWKCRRLVCNVYSKISISEYIYKGTSYFGYFHRATRSSRGQHLYVTSKGIFSIYFFSIWIGH
jgi:hypothetical protein